MKFTLTFDHFIDAGEVRLQLSYFVPLNILYDLYEIVLISGALTFALLLLFSL